MSATLPSLDPLQPTGRCASCRRFVVARRGLFGAECAVCEGVLPDVTIPAPSSLPAPSQSASRAAVTAEVAEAMLQEFADRGATLGDLAEAHIRAHNLVDDARDADRAAVERRESAQYWRERLAMFE